MRVIVGICVCVCLHVYKSLCMWDCSWVSWATNSSAHTWLHSSTFRHSDESHAPFLHFCSLSILLGQSYLSAWHTYTLCAELSLSLCFNQRYTLLVEKYILNVLIFPRCPSQMCLVARLVLTLNLGKLMNSPATSLCQQRSNQACLWLQQNCPSAFSSNGCHSIGDHRTWARNEPRGDEWRREEKGGEQRSSIWEENETFKRMESSVEMSV